MEYFLIALYTSIGLIWWTVQVIDLKKITITDLAVSLPVCAAFGGMALVAYILGKINRKLLDSGLDVVLIDWRKK